jgi:hypothetical protein
MIICPSCKHTEADGAIFCSECGAQLVRFDGQTQSFQELDADFISAPVDEERIEVGNAWISLHLIESGEILPISERTDFTLGRVSENQPIMPDLDLTPYKAYDNGVSRLHAVIRRNPVGAAVMDLGSANGTYINGVRIHPNIEQPLHHGDVVALGKLKMQIILS